MAVNGRSGIVPSQSVGLLEQEMRSSPRFLVDHPDVLAEYAEEEEEESEQQLHECDNRAKAGEGNAEEEGAHRDRPETDE